MPSFYKCDKTLVMRTPGCERPRYSFMPSFLKGFTSYGYKDEQVRKLFLILAMPV